MNVLVIAPHYDDEILGVGGTIAKHIAQGNDVYVCVIARGSKKIFTPELLASRDAEAVACHKFLGIKETISLNFEATHLEHVNRIEINQKILDVIQRIKPEEVYIPHYGDMHKDHNIVTNSVMVALRPKYDHIVSRVYCYETPSETGWNIPGVVTDFMPNVYNDISDFLEIKFKAMSFYQSQLSPFPNPRSIEALDALARFRGSVSGCNAAEAFSLVREIKTSEIQP